MTLTNLTHFSISNHVLELDFVLSRLVNLTHFETYHRTLQIDIDNSLRFLAKLKVLAVAYNSHITGETFKGLKNLTELNLWENRQITASDISCATGLKKLGLFYTPAYGPELSTLSSLETLTVDYQNYKFPEVNLGQFKNLIELKLRGNIMFTDGNLANLPMLRKLTLVSIYSLEGRSIRNLTNLKVLYIDYCEHNPKSIEMIT